MRRLLVAIALLALSASACARIPGVGGGDSRVVLIDYSHDEFASFFLEYFPYSLKVHPGDTVEFKQTWTGEPHSVTMGTLVNDFFAWGKPIIDKFRAGEEVEETPELDAEFERRIEPLPWMFGEEDKIAQNGAQPCFLDEGRAPKDSNTPCPKNKQKQPEFNGKHSYYNSGFIPYEGPNGNKFTVKLADQIDEGTYYYYCNLHGPLMSGSIIVVPESEEIPSQDEVNRQAREEIQKMAKPLRDSFEQAESGKMEPPDELKEQLVKPGETFFSGNLAGLMAPDVPVHGGINEFIPRTIRAKVGEEVTWVMLGGHTISFDVPEYLPIMSVKKDGSVVRNPKLDKPAGGSPPLPEEGEGEGPPEPVDLDAGTWDGSGFFSSGLIYGDPFAKYTLRISKPGTYAYACLVHPPMVGKVIVR